jgi:hypothetical protein
MRPLSNDLREFIHLLNTKSVRYVIVDAWRIALPPEDLRLESGEQRGANLAFPQFVVPTIRS